MANSRSKALAVLLRYLVGNDDLPRHLAVTIPDFTESALRYVLLVHDAQDVAQWGGLVRVGHTMGQWERRVSQKLMHKAVQLKHNYVQEDKVGMYQTFELFVWRDTYNCVDSLPLWQRDFCSPRGVYVASLVHEVDHGFGTLGV